MSCYKLNGQYVKLGGKYLGYPSPSANFSMELDTTGTHFIVNQDGVLTNWADVRRAGFNAVDDAVQVATVAQGTGNDAQAFQTAVTTALNSPEYANGQKVYIYILDGNYTIATNIDVPSSRIIFKGQSRDGVVIDAAGNDLGTNGIFLFYQCSENGDPDGSNVYQDYFSR